MNKRIVAGVYIERHQGTIVCLPAQSGLDDDQAPYEMFDFENVEFEQLHWNPHKPAEAERGLKELANLLSKMESQPTSLAVSCYGPFVSLDPRHSAYGQVDPERADEPLKGKNLAEIFRPALAKARGDHVGKLLIHTDANACALGEAVARNLPRTHALAFVLVTEGIGAGFVTGRAIHQSALHPEIGLLPVRVHADDPLRPELYEQAYARSANGLADNSALRERAGMMYRNKVRYISKISDDSFWDFRAYYLAQLCLAATAIVAPHQIIIACDIDPDKGDLVGRTARRFRRFLQNLQNEGNPVFKYPELDSIQFISASTPIPGLPISASIAATGVMGMAYAAAWNSRMSVTRY
jgi:predicted NBD/HSP70 family sugar kinase